MIDKLEAILNSLSSFVWGPILIFLLYGCGVYLTFKLRFIQFRYFLHGLKSILGFYDAPGQHGEISHFQALCTALSATIGVGNIAGVATAIAIGGPGAVFWMWLTAVFGMATKFSSCTLGHKFRVGIEGSFYGGPMYYIEKAVKSRPLAIIFAICCAISALGIGNMVQSNSLADAIKTTFNIPSFITGLILGLIVWLVIIGGIKRIAKVARTVVPFMCLLYCISALAIIFLNPQQALSALKLIFSAAFNPDALAGGVAGGMLIVTIRIGTARGLFSNEAGLGSAPIAHAAAKTNESIREGFVAMLGPFIDTIVVCTMTALIIIMSGLWQAGLSGATLTVKSFDFYFPNKGELIVSFGIIFFAFTTVIGWSYYGEVAFNYLLGRKAIFFYRWLYCLVLPIGAVLKLEIVWSLADIANGLMAFPNLIALFALSGLVAKELKDYISRHKLL